MMKFCTAIACMDGRIQEPVLEYIKKKTGCEYVDMITDPGPVKALSDDKNSDYFESVLESVCISTEKHGSRRVFIAGHHDCAANPVEKALHVQQIKKSVARIQSKMHDVACYGLYVNENWQCEPV
ncbi:MAG: carbonic anhydrase [bacterium]